MGPIGLNVLAFAILLFECSATVTLAKDNRAENPDSQPSTKLTGKIQYQPDSSRPWRFGRYYLHGAEKLLSEAVVELVPADPDIPFKSKPERKAKTHLMDQENFMFIPETLAIHIGDKVRFRNSEEAYHNVMCLDDQPPFNVNLAKDQEHVHEPKVAKGAKSPLNIRCVFHGAMNGWIYVFKHPYFHLTDQSGSFSFSGFPEGSYKLRISHPSGKLFLETSVKDIRKFDHIKWNILLTPDHLKAESNKSTNQHKTHP